MSEIHVSREDAKARRDIEEVAAIVVERQKPIPIRYQGIELDECFRLGLLINFGAPLLRDGLQCVVNKHTNFASSRLRVHQQEA